MKSVAPREKLSGSFSRVYNINNAVLTFRISDVTFVDVLKT